MSFNAVCMIKKCSQTCSRRKILLMELSWGTFAPCIHVQWPKQQATSSSSRTSRCKVSSLAIHGMCVHKLCDENLTNLPPTVLCKSHSSYSCCHSSKFDTLVNQQDHVSPMRSTICRVCRQGFAGKCSHYHPLLCWDFLLPLQFVRGHSDRV